MLRTTISIQAADFLIDGRLSYEGRSFDGMRIEGLLLNSRMVNGIFDDLNPQTRYLWDYPDGPWDPQRNTREFVAAMSDWRDHGLLSFTINLQGGSPHATAIIRTGSSLGSTQPSMLLAIFGPTTWPA
jgi:hypothetical protein